jgi:mRNA-degrading endonuclease RelE of RelBE toxin-antitoxin system
MAYEVVLSEKAIRSLNALEEPIRSFVEARLSLLGESPSAVSRPSVSPPYPPGGMMYEFDYDISPSTRHHFGVFFIYAVDETRILIVAIGHTVLYYEDGF